MKKKILYIAIALILALGIGIGTYKCCHHPNTTTTRKHNLLDRFPKKKCGKYWVVDSPTPHISKGKNEVKGIVLHHTANKNIYDALSALTNPRTRVSSHALIDKDGTRFILAQPTQITWHAGYSMLNGRERCNEFTIGIEFQGNTKKAPLTDDQINSAIDYILPIMNKYHIKNEDIVTHETIRHNWIVKHHNPKVHEKVDITQEEYKHFMRILNKRLKTKK